MGIFFGNGTKSRKNRSTFQQRRISLNKELTVQFGIGNLSDLSTEQSSIRARVFAFTVALSDTVISAVSSEKADSFGYKKGIEARLSSDGFSTRTYANLIIGYSLAIIKTHNPALEDGGVLKFISSLDLSDSAKRLIFNSYKYVLDDFEMANHSKDYISFAEGCLSEYLVSVEPKLPNSKDKDLLGSAGLNVLIMTYISFYLKNIGSDRIPSL